MKIIWTAGHWQAFYCLAEHLGETESVKTLDEHGIYADHCGGYDVLAWPCPDAARALDHIAAVCP